MAKTLWFLSAFVVVISFPSVLTKPEVQPSKSKTDGDNGVDESIVPDLTNAFGWIPLNIPINRPQTNNNNNNNNNPTATPSDCPRQIRGCTQACPAATPGSPRTCPADTAGTCVDPRPACTAPRCICAPLCDLNCRPA